MRTVVAVLAGVALLAGCDDAAPVAIPGGRVVAVSEPNASGPDLAGFCDQYDATAVGTALGLPPLDSEYKPVQGRARWVNVWATWCKPCVEEIPRLLAWQKRIAESGTELDLVFVSVDVDAAAIDEFRKAHPEMPASLHVQGAEPFSEWLPSVGLAAGSPIPLHLYADRLGHRRCVRAGAVSEADFPIVQALVKRHP